MDNLKKKLVHELNVFSYFLAHTCNKCDASACSLPLCKEMRALLAHFVSCPGKFEAQCKKCNQYLYILRYHALYHCRKTFGEKCGVPSCDDMRLVHE